MTNEVANVFGGKVGFQSTEALKDAMAQSAGLDPRSGGADGSVFMNFSGKRGIYEIGTEKRDTSPDELWLVNIAAFEDGWVCWKGGKPVATRLVKLGQPVPQVNMEEHGPFDTKRGEGWTQAKSMIVRSIDEGTQAYFKINSLSGVSVFAQLQQEITSRLMLGRPAWPIVGFDKESFEAQGYKNFKPKIIVDGWLNDEQVVALAAVFEDDETQIDLQDMYAASEAPKAIDNTPTGGETKKVTRNRRAGL